MLLFQFSGCRDEKLKCWAELLEILWNLEVQKLQFLDHPAGGSSKHPSLSLGTLEGLHLRSRDEKTEAQPSINLILDCIKICSYSSCLPKIKVNPPGKKTPIIHLYNLYTNYLEYQNIQMTRSPEKNILETDISELSDIL